MSMPRPHRRVAAALLALVAAVIAVTALTGHHAQAAAPANTQVALLPTPSCPDPGANPRRGVTRNGDLTARRST